MVNFTDPKQPALSDDVIHWQAVLMGGESLQEDALYLDFGGVVLRLRSNCKSLVERLRFYFSPVLSNKQVADIEVVAIEREPLSLDVTFKDWHREPGKTGRKDSYFDVPGGRLIRKVRTGMVFLQCQGVRLAAGPCVQNDNQIINFVNAQLANAFQQKGALTCHAAGVVRNGCGFAMAGFSGGGKSTLMLHLLNDENINYLTNDRLYLKAGSSQEPMGYGIPKLPRVNPGTIIHNPKLHSLLPKARRAELQQLPAAELWDLEEKYDVIIDEVYGLNRITSHAPISGFLVLNWQRDSQDEISVHSIDISERRDLLAAIMKSPGPFYQRADGTMHQDSLSPDETAYIEALAGVRVYEVTGGVDFAALAQICSEQLMD